MAQIVLLAVGLLWVVLTASAASRPNIVIILSDDMGYSDLGCYGGEIETPNLDRLARNGLRFTQFYNTARCCPTRASLLTGLYPHQANVGHMIGQKRNQLPAYRGDLSTNVVTVADMLRSAGYRTYMAGKWHVARNTHPNGPIYNWPLQRGFDRYYGTIVGAGDYFDPAGLTLDNKSITIFTDPTYPAKDYYYTDALTEYAIRFVKEHQRNYGDRPFFLYLAYTAAHWPLHARDSDIAKYKGRYEAGYDAIAKARFERAAKLGLIDRRWLPPSAGNWSAVTNKAWEARCMEVYAAQIDAMDRGIGRFLSALERNGELKNTLIFFLQDNGGCAEGIGRGGHETRPAAPTLPLIALDVLATNHHPKQMRSGYPVLGGDGVLPGPEDTFIAYGEKWARVSNTPFREYKHWTHEGGIATPLIVHWPEGIPTNRRGKLVTDPGHLIDLAATCVEVASAKAPKSQPLEGVNLLPAFKGDSLKRTAPIFFEHEGNRALRDGRWKLVAKGPAGKWELYDMEDDRSERFDLASSQPALLADLIGKWEAWAKRANVIPWIWRPQYGAKETDPFNDEKQFELTPADILAREDAPQIVKRAFTIRAEILEPAQNGVIVAQGGSAHGYSLYVRDGKPIFALRQNRKLHTVVAQESLPSRAVVLEAQISRDGRVVLRADKRIIATGDSNGGLLQLPGEGLEVGKDSGGAVGNYAVPFEFKGKIGKVTIEIE